MMANTSTIFRVAPRALIRTSIQRNLASTSVSLNTAAGPTDPIQNLFVNKVSITIKRIDKCNKFIK